MSSDVWPQRDEPAAADATPAARAAPKTVAGVGPLLDAFLDAARKHEPTKRELSALLRAALAKLDDATPAAPTRTVRRGFIPGGSAPPAPEPNGNLVTAPRRAVEPPPVAAAPAPPRRAPAFVAGAAPIDRTPNDALHSCRLKAEACEWAVERRKVLGGARVVPPDIARRDAELNDRARQIPGCVLWMLDPYAQLPADDFLLDFAGVYRNAGTATERVETALAETRPRGDGNDEPATRERLLIELSLAAEAYSALRVAFEAVPGRRGREPDQETCFRWLSGLTSTHRIFVRRFMTLSDQASPAQWPDLEARLLVPADETAEPTRTPMTERQQLFAKLKTHLQRRHEDPAEHWDRVVEIVDRLVPEIVPANDSELLNLLRPTVEDLPEELEVGPGTDDVLNILESEAPPPPPPPPPAPARTIGRRGGA